MSSFWSPITEDGLPDPPFTFVALQGRQETTAPEILAGIDHYFPLGKMFKAKVTPLRNRRFLVRHEPTWGKVVHDLGYLKLTRGIRLPVIRGRWAEEWLSEETVVTELGGATLGPITSRRVWDEAYHHYSDLTMYSSSSDEEGF